MAFSSKSNPIAILAVVISSSLSLRLNTGSVSAGDDNSGVTFPMVHGLESGSASGSVVTFHNGPEEETTLHKQNVCDQTEGTWPVLYHKYTEEDCPAPNHFDPNGIDCEYQKIEAGNGDLDCGSFCQLTTVFEYGVESPFPMSYCNYPITCSISESDSTSWDWGIGFSPKIGKLLKIGISGNYGESRGTSTGRSWSFKPELGQCGYFSFVPIKKTVWYVHL